MRPIEITLAFVLAARILTRHRFRWLEYLPILAAIIQIVFEGYRWQLVPMYLLTIFIGIISVRRLDPWRERSERFSPWFAVLGGFTLLALTLTPAIVFPIPHPRAPEGPFSVGTSTWYLVDESRTDPYAPEPDSPRRLVVQSWYPAEDTNGQQAAWMPQAELVAPAISAWVEMPPFFLDHLVYAKTDSRQDAAVLAGGPYPLIVFSHGWGGFRAQNTSQAQLLASLGYVVVAVEHTYSAVITVFPDGTRAYHNPDTLPDDVTDVVFRTAVEDLMTQWTGDFDFLLENLAAWNAQPEHLFHGRLDLERIGLMGHSTGGRAVLQFCSRDPRCKAGLLMDPWLMDEEVEAFRTGPSQPLLFMFSEGWRSGPESRRFQEYFQHIPGKPPVFTIRGTGHYDFTDLPALSPLSAALGLKGPLSGDRVLDIIFFYTSHFFEGVFGEGMPVDLRASNPLFPELIFYEP